MAARDFEKLLSQHIGLDGASVGHELIARAVQEGQRRSGAADANAYFELVTRSGAELQALIETVVVVETWFFRDPEAFGVLTRELCVPWVAANAGGVARLLSLPCATGEEPYSMAMALSDAGLPLRRFAIEGTDISERALARARAGVFGNNAFRGKDTSFRERHFEPVPRGYRLREEIRAAVSFRSGNLLSATPSRDSGSYHAIFCRNLLIYLDGAARQRALELIEGLLVPNGLLFVGPSETSLVSSDEFVPLRIPLAFAFRKSAERARSGPRPVAEGSVLRPLPALASPAAGMPAGALPAPVPRTVRGASRRSASPQVLPKRVVMGPAPTTSKETAIDSEAHHERIVSLADRGQLTDAYRLCAEHERIHGPSARLYHLMGLLREAARDLDDAAAYHKKALYLDPDHEEALTHLALLLEQRGDTAGADRLRQRARRRASKAGR